MGKVISNRKKLAAIFASFTILIMGAASLLESMSLDYYSVLNTLQKVIPASIIIGWLGWVMGMILDRPKKRKKSKISYNNLFLDKNEKNDINKSPDIGDIPDIADISPVKSEGDKP
jgi:hypothetical protein